MALQDCRRNRAAASQVPVIYVAQEFDPHIHLAGRPAAGPDHARFHLRSGVRANAGQRVAGLDLVKADDLRAVAADQLRLRLLFPRLPRALANATKRGSLRALEARAAKARAIPTPTAARPARARAPDWRVTLQRRRCPRRCACSLPGNVRRLRHSVRETAGHESALRWIPALCRSCPGNAGSKENGPPAMRSLLRHTCPCCNDPAFHSPGRPQKKIGQAVYRK